MIPDPVAFLRRLVEIRSHSGQEHDVAVFLRDQMARAGLIASLDEVGNAVAATRGDPLNSVPGLTDLALVGHMDTVPGDIPVRIENGRLYGRGAIDAKGPLAAFVCAAARARLPEGLRLVVAGATEEESASSRGARAIAPRYSPAACVIGEPSHWDAVTVGYKGRLLVHYNVTRAMSHSAGPAPSAGDQVFEWWERVRADVRDLVPDGASPFHGVQAMLRELGTTSDWLSESARAVASFRIPPGVAPERIAEICRAHAAGGDARPEGPEVAYVADARSPLARAFSQSIRALGGVPRLLLKTGTSDMNVLGPLWACPFVAYGAGDSLYDHTPDEHIILDEWLRSIDVLVLAIERWAAGLAALHPPGVRSTLTTCLSESPSSAAPGR